MIFYEIIEQLGWCRESLLACVGVVVAIVAALVAHEVAHGLVALWNGDDTARLAGRLSLNPMVHFDPFGLMLMLVVGFGYARPVPVNPDNYKHRRLGEVTVSLAGVVTNILGAFFCALLYLLCFRWLIVTETDSAAYYIATFLTYTFSFALQINISFALFNILPLYPLDGYRFIAAFTGENNGFLTFMRRNGMYFMLAIILLDWLFTLVPSLEIYSPFYWYFNVVGGGIESGFMSFWGLVI